jgi:SAM-dependent methyltransferase
VKIPYYDQNADEFFDRTVEIDVSEIRDVFLEFLPEGGSILDAGCGSGRDTKAFLNSGYLVQAFDVSTRMTQLASEFTGVEVIETSFLDYGSKTQFDGIWACASLLHVPRGDLLLTIQHLAKLLRIGGFFYASFKQGQAERFTDGRYFNDMDESLFDELLSGSELLEPEKIWITIDGRLKERERWFNTIFRRIEIK